jgi:hypothetical protein
MLHCAGNTSSWRGTLLSKVTALPYLYFETHKISIIHNLYRSFSGLDTNSIFAKCLTSYKILGSYTERWSKNEWRYTSTPQYAFMAWCSVKSTGTTLPLPFTLNGNSWYRSISPAKGWTTGVQFPAWAQIVSFTKSTPTLEPTALPRHWVLGDLYSGIRWTECAAYHSASSTLSLPFTETDTRGSFPS